VFVKVAPWKQMLRFGKKEKLVLKLGKRLDLWPIN
jgi:hypothetical protein